MAKKKSRQTYLKRQRELQRMEKAELKRQRRLERKRGEFPIQSSPYGDAEKPELKAVVPPTQVPRGEPIESMEIGALRRSLGLDPLPESSEPVASGKSAESSESEPPPPEGERS